MLFSKNRKTNKMVAQAILGIIAAQYIGLLALVGFDLSKVAVMQFSLALLLTAFGSIYVLWGITENKLGGS